MHCARLPAHTPCCRAQSRVLVTLSSTTLLQSSSLPLQISAAGPTEPRHAPNFPAAHCWVPATHSPTSVPQAWVWPSWQGALGLSEMHRPPLPQWYPATQGLPPSQEL